MKKLAALMAVLLALLPVAASADVSRGDRGEEVRYLQWLLKNTGWLSENPDGIFGGHTEQAVMDYQASKGYEQTGIATTELMLEMDEDRARQDREQYGDNYYQPYSGNFTPPSTASDNAAVFAPEHCSTSMLPGIAYREYCEAHLPVLQQEFSLTAQSEAKGYAEASALWHQEIHALFEAWIRTVTEEQKMDVLAAWTAWNACFDEQVAAMNAAWDTATVEKQAMAMRKNFAASLCEIRSGEPLSSSAPDFEQTFSAAAQDPSCRQWSIATGTEFVTCCEAHAPLFEREYRWMSDGAENDDELREIANGWNQALQALYDQWLSRCDDQQAEAVHSAWDLFTQALDCLDAALAADGERTVLEANLRVQQYECARLCELLNAVTEGD